MKFRIVASILVLMVVLSSCGNTGGSNEDTSNPSDNVSPDNTASIIFPEIDPNEYIDDISNSKYYQEQFPNFHIIEIQLYDRVSNDDTKPEKDILYLEVVSVNHTLTKIGYVQWIVEYAYENSARNMVSFEPILDGKYAGGTISEYSHDYTGTLKEYEPNNDATPFVVVKYHTPTGEARELCVNGDRVVHESEGEITGIKSAFHGNLHVFNEDSVVYNPFTYERILLDTKQYMLCDRGLFKLTDVIETRLAASGDALAYKKSDKSLYLIEVATGTEQFIASNVDDFKISYNGKQVVFQAEGNLFLYTAQNGVVDLKTTVKALGVADTGAIYAAENLENGPVTLYYIYKNHKIKQLGVVYSFDGYILNEYCTEMIFDGTIDGHAADYGYSINGADLCDASIPNLALKADVMEGAIYKIKSIFGNAYYETDGYTVWADYLNSENTYSMAMDCHDWQKSPYGDLYYNYSDLWDASYCLQKIESMTNDRTEIDSGVAKFMCGDTGYYYINSKKLKYAKYATVFGEEDVIVNEHIADAGHNMKLLVIHDTCYYTDATGALWCSINGDESQLLLDQKIHKMNKKGEYLYCFVVNTEYYYYALNSYILYIIDPELNVLEIGISEKNVA